MEESRLLAKIMIQDRTSLAILIAQIMILNMCGTKSIITTLGILLCSYVFSISAAKTTTNEQKVVTVVTKDRATCTTKKILQGTWKYITPTNNTQPHKGNLVTDWSKCRKTRHNIKETDLFYQDEFYACPNTWDEEPHPGWKHAVFITNSSTCTFPTLRQSMEKLQKFRQASWKGLHPSPNSLNAGVRVEGKKLLQGNNAKNDVLYIVFVGDSLGGQVALAAMCDLEKENLDDKTKITYLEDHFLRNDLPCNPKCTNVTFLSQHLDVSPYPCQACPDPLKPRPRFDTKSKDWWPNRLPADTFIVILNSGVWYSNMKDFVDDTESLEKEYERTLRITKQGMETLKKAKNVIPLWVPLPPVQEREQANKKYNWELFEGRDKKANALFPNEIVEVNAAIRARKQVDPFVCSDNMHYCNPGTATIPSFIFRAAMAMAAQKIEFMT